MQPLYLPCLARYIAIVTLSKTNCNVTAFTYKHFYFLTKFQKLSLELFYICFYGLSTYVMRNIHLRKWQLHKILNLTLFTSCVVMSLIFMTSLKKKCNNNFLHELFIILLSHNHELAMTVPNIFEHSFHSMQFSIILCFKICD